ncbi:MAG TPA: hypothetical protein VN372_14100 [Methanospirillum sp.]|nr:hypothetical protein [Methanospirillum sp.]
MNSQQAPIRGTRAVGFLLLVLISCVIIGAGSVSAAAPASSKIPTQITMTINPASPGIHDDFTVTGVLTTNTGEILGNKYIILESTAAGKRPGKLTFLENVRTQLDGSYYFYRPAASPPETLRVRFDGNYVFNATMSQEITVKK